MKKLLQYSLFAAAALLSGSCNAQSPWTTYEHLFIPARHYIAYQADGAITIDGKADERSWAEAEWSDDYVDIEGDKQPKPLYRTRMKMLWDENYLYILTEMEEPDIWCYYDKRDMVVFHENDIEVFIDPDGDGLNYFEYEVNALNNLFDLFLPKSYRSAGQALISYNSLDFQSAVSIDGTLNTPGDTDKKWTVEMKIPFSDLVMWGSQITPNDGDQWRINFSRVNWQTDVKDGKYVKKTNSETGKPLPEYNWVWSAPGIISMHAPERYGLVQFSNHKAGEAPVAFNYPADQHLRDCCWLIFYKQQAYHSKNKTYATTLDQLGLSETLERNGQTFQVKLTATPYQYKVFVTSPDNKTFSVNNDGFIQAVLK